MVEGGGLLASLVVGGRNGDEAPGVVAIALDWLRR